MKSLFVVSLSKVNDELTSAYLTIKSPYHSYDCSN